MCPTTSFPSVVLCLVPLLLPIPTVELPELSLPAERLSAPVKLLPGCCTTWRTCSEENFEQ